MEDNEHLVWKDSFYKDNFNVDQCLSEYTQKSDLDSLRKELKSLGDDLQQQMSDILKTETEAIVNLAEYLTNLNFKIESLSSPVCQLREEIMTLNNLIHSSEDSCKHMLDELRNNTLRRSNINLQLGITLSSLYIENLIESSSNILKDLFLLERLVCKYAFERNYMIGLGIVSPETVSILKIVETKLLKHINDTFLAAFMNDDSEVMMCSLRMYDAMQKQKEAHDIFKQKVVKPFMEKLFTESNLDKHNNDIEQLYNEALNFMHHRMRVLCSLQSKPDVKGFNFSLYSFWIEFDKNIRQGLPNLTAPGNPELFQKRFKATWIMLTKIAEQCGDIRMVTLDNTFQEHVKRFNLPVYFEICYQKIAGELEKSISNDDIHTAAGENDHSFHLKVSLVLWKCIVQCFHESVYIDQLADQFIKLSLMLFGRYSKKIKNNFEQSTYTSNEVLEDFNMNALFDFDIFVKLIALDTNHIETSIFKIMNKNLWPILGHIFKVNQQVIADVQQELKNKLVDIKYEESSTHLYNVASIPRLYRKTNRVAPKEPSGYMIDAVKPITSFHKKFGHSMENHTKDILEVTIEKLTKQYTTLVQEVLTSVCKTEESLRRLKNRNLNLSGEHAPQDSVSDERKIREQIKYDVNYFVKEMCPLVSKKCKEMLDILKNDICQ
nr:unnamed protein product [Callosobruchus analis]